MTNQYAHPIDFIIEGIKACWFNARDLAESAGQMKNQKRHGPALSLAVLAIEEIGKVYLVNIFLLYAQSGDLMSKVFKIGYRSHLAKLSVLDGDNFPLLLRSLAGLDPRYGREKRFEETLVVTIRDYQRARQALETWLGPAYTLYDLDAWKQKGFYVHTDSSGNFVRPAEIDPNLSAAVVQLAVLVVDAVNPFLIDNIEMHEEWMRSIRQVVTEEELVEKRRHIDEILQRHSTAGSETSESKGDGGGG